MFLFVHGETEWNRARRFQGRADSPLTDLGREQAETLARILRAQRDDPAGYRIVSSPLGRALTTAQIVARAFGIDPIAIAIDERLVEIDVGAWSGLTRKEAVALDPARLADITRHEWSYLSPDGENFDGVSRRAAAFLADHAEHQDLVVSTHGITSRLLRGLYTGAAREDLIGAPIERGIVFRLTGGAVARLGPDTLS